jgi:hypothetical protein
MAFRRFNDDSGDPANQKRCSFAITDGEINFLWSFIQGSIINPETWSSLLSGYGFCQRHAWIHLRFEMAFRGRYLLGPTILYAALVEKALSAVHSRHTFSRRRLLTGPSCLFCILKIVNLSGGASPQRRLLQGRDTRPLREFALDLNQFWSDHVCGTCKHDDGEARCRRHLLADLRAGTHTDILRQEEMLRELHERIIRFQESFTAGKLKASDQECASLIAAVGWCSGWQPLLALLDSCQWAKS